MKQRWREHGPFFSSVRIAAVTALVMGTIALSPPESVRGGDPTQPAPTEFRNAELDGDARSTNTVGATAAVGDTQQARSRRRSARRWWHWLLPRPDRSVSDDLEFWYNELKACEGEENKSSYASDLRSRVSAREFWDARTGWLWMAGTYICELEENPEARKKAHEYYEAARAHGFERLGRPWLDEDGLPFTDTMPCKLHRSVASVLEPRRGLQPAPCSAGTPAPWPPRRVCSDGRIDDPLTLEDECRSAGSRRS